MNVLIIDHYATRAFNGQGGRQYYFAKELAKIGCNVNIICSNVDHYSNHIVDTDKKVSKTLKDDNNNDWTFVNTLKYSRVQTKKRWLNVLDFYFKLLFSYKKIIKNKPDVIIASSVHPLTLVAGIKIAKKLGVPCICEIKDLWPLSIVEYSSLTNKNIIIKALYKLEKWCYKKADALIFSIEGGAKYIVDQGWDDVVDLKKVHYINNGVCLDSFNKNKEEFVFEDEDLDNPNLFKIVYTGTISKVNGVIEIVNAAESLIDCREIKFLIFGNGSDKEELEKYCKDNNLSNVNFFGLVEKKYVPSIVFRASLNIINIEPKDNIYKYGVSMNKIFEYLASGKPILSTFQVGFSIIDKYKAGVTTADSLAYSVKKAIIDMYNIKDTVEYSNYCNNALLAAKDFDFKVHSKKLNKILLGVKKDYETTNFK